MKGHWRSNHELVCKKCGWSIRAGDFRKWLKRNKKKYQGEICPVCETKLGYY